MRRRPPQQAPKSKRSTKNWNSVRVVLASKSTAELLALTRDLFALSQENRDFLSARYLVRDERLEPYKEAIDEALYQRKRKASGK